MLSVYFSLFTVLSALFPYPAGHFYVLLCGLVMQLILYPIVCYRLETALVSER